ncbi:MAG: CarD family transcriptional regulator [Lachnoclostridium sp.]|nr:CarD family transcriptional regulator [Lachnospira sp.]MCM1247551.1 CarD family transcriptional regulator [Lachnoclostridium sp.]
MFEKGEYVVCGSKGVCLVEDITTLDISGVDKERQYYILKPVYVAGSTVYLPVDATRESIRRILSREEAKELIHVIPEIPLITITNDKLLEQEYRGCIRSNNCKEWIKIIKTIYLRKQKRIEAGRKVTAVDAKYFRLAEDNLYGELAVSLGMPREEVESYITGEIA